MPGLDSGKHLSRREDDNYFSAVRGSWPVDDDTLLMAGRGASLYGASPDQAAVVGQSRAWQLLHAGAGLAVHIGMRNA